MEEFGSQPQKPVDRGILLDALFNRRHQEDPKGFHAGLGGDANAGAGFGLNRKNTGGFGITTGNGQLFGLNYGSADEWGGDAKGWGMGNGGSGWYYGGPYAGPPMILRPAKSPTKAGSAAASTTPSPGSTTGSSDEGDDETTSESDGGASTTESSGGSTLSPIQQSEALVKAFGGGEKPSIQQLGPPIIVPYGSVPGMRGLMGIAKAPRGVKPGEQIPMYGKLVLGPPKFAQSVFQGRGAGGAGFGFNHQGKGFMTLVKNNKPMIGANYGTENGFGNSMNFGGNGNAAANAGFRSVQAVQPMVQQNPPVIRYVPVIETVRRRRMKAILAQPV